VADNAWFEGSNSPGAGDLGQMQALQDNLATTADAARHAKSDLSGLKDHVSDAVWRGQPAEEFKNNIDTKFLGNLDKLDASYQDAADGFQSYISAVSDIKDQATTIASKIYAAQSHYDVSAGGLNNWLGANSASGSYSHGDLHASTFHQGSPYTVTYHSAPAPSGASASPGAADAAAATSASAQQSHASLQAAVNDAWDGLQSLYRQMDGLQTHDRVAADNAVVGRLSQAHDAGVKNESGWHHFFHALSTVAKWAGIVLLVIAIVAVIVLVPALGVMGALAAVTTVGGATAGGLTVASLVIYGGAAASAVALVGDVGQRETGGGPGWGKVALDVVGIVPGLGKATSLVARLGAPAETFVGAMDNGVVTSKLASVLKIESLFEKVEYTPLGVRFAGITGVAERGVDAFGNAILGFGEITPVTSKLGAAKWSLLKLNGLWGGASNIFPQVGKAALGEAAKVEWRATTQDPSAAEARQQIRQFQASNAANAAKAHDIAANLARGTKAVFSYPSQHSYPQPVPVH
jgi:hypothetical protein